MFKSMFYKHKKIVTKQNYNFTMRKLNSSKSFSDTFCAIVITFMLVKTLKMYNYSNSWYFLYEYSYGTQVKLISVKNIVWTWLFRILNDLALFINPPSEISVTHTYPIRILTQKAGVTDSYW